MMATYSHKDTPYRGYRAAACHVRTEYNTYLFVYIYYTCRYEYTQLFAVYIQGDPFKCLYIFIIFEKSLFFYFFFILYLIRIVLFVS